jgi:transcription initiation factor TFIIE subunit alpha
MEFVGVMRLTNKVIEELVSEVAGKDVVPLVLNLKNKRNVSEFTLAEHIDREINETRNMLYRLYNENLVSFIRRKDKKRGWYIYYWTFNKKRIHHLMAEVKKQRLSGLYDRLDREKNNNFFVCTNKCIRLDFEQATEFEFKCPECGNLLNHEDNDECIKELKGRIEKIKHELSAI